MTINILDSVSLLGDGQYNLNNVKEIFVTDYFMELDQNTRKCQNFETQDDCITSLYIERLRKECGCLPLFLRLSGKVKLQYFNKGS